MLPPEKNDEPDGKDEGTRASPDPTSPDEPAATSGRRQRKTSERQPEELAATEPPDGATASREEGAADGEGKTVAAADAAGEESGPEPEGKGTDEGTQASPEPISPDEPAATSGRRQRRTTESEPEELAATETPDDTTASSGEGAVDGEGKTVADDDASREESGPEPETREPVAEAYDPALREHRTGADQETADAEGGAHVAMAERPKQSERVAGAGPALASPPQAARSGGGFLAVLLAAILGGLIGAGGIWYYLQQREPTGPDPEVVAALEEQQNEVVSQAERLAAIEGDIGSLNEALSATDVSDAIEQLRMDAEGRLDGVAEALTTALERLDALEARLDRADQQIAELEARPIADPETASQVLRSEVADMRAEVEQATEEARAQVETMRNDLAAAAEETQEQILAAEQRAAELEAQAQERIRQAEAEAEALARAAEAEAALAQIDAALDSGEPFPDALAAWRENSDRAVPEALASVADTGVPTVAELRADYPDAARAALSATAVARTEGDPGGRLVAFLRDQTQARSLTPQEGDSPDAILSRAEAALEDGNVSAALAELEALPEEGRAAMQGWIDDARRRADAVAAADSLLQDMN